MNATYDAYIEILKRELVPAMGCTEPIAIAYAAALSRDVLGERPERIEAFISSDIIKNVKSVIVPNTGGLRGISAAVSAGVVAGEADKELEVISDVKEEVLCEIERYLRETPMDIQPSESGCVFDILMRVYSGKDEALVRIAGHHTNVVRIEKNGRVLQADESFGEEAQDDGLYSALNVRDIVDFADRVDLEPVRDVLRRQIEYNMAISYEGLAGSWGAQIGKILLDAYGESVHNRAKAAAAAGSDARMSGCELPVVINSGSGNQGITASVPVIVYAEHLGSGEDLLCRALLVSNLVAIHMKDGIGKLSAYCGAIIAGCGAAAGITYLYGGRFHEIAHTIVNAVAINSGVICDGAKPSCAAKIASAVEAGLLGMQMQMHGSEFVGGDGIVTKGVENTIDNVSCLARFGMADTDKEILKIMIGERNE